jgi:putative FmdB family regulatory protein
VPIYEFRCRDCRRRTSVFTRTIGGGADAVCSRCGSRDMSRLISRVAVIRSEDDAFSSIDESALADVDEQDPRSMARWVRKMSREMGEPLDAETQGQLERMEAGEMPDDLDDGGDDDSFAGEW